jgi:hypothetical protein
MSPSSRVKIIKEIAKRLGEEEWSIIDLTLRQFNFSIPESFSGGTSDYVIQQIEEGNDDQLYDLAEHLEVQIGEVQHSAIQANFWKDGYFKVFISHLASKKETAAELKDALEAFAISAFVAHEDVKPAKEWQDEIELALRTCDCVVALMDEGFHRSKWTDQELGFAIGRDLPIIPINMGTEPYGLHC